MSRYKGNTTVQLKSPTKSIFDLGHEKRITAAMGKLIPINCEELIPGDTARGNSEILLRLAPLLAPIYDQITLFVHNFFVPNRLIWGEEWEEMITGGRLGVGIDPVAAPVPPFINVGEYAAQGLLQKYSMFDYLGVPPIPTASAAAWDDVEIDAMPPLGMALIWYEFYRDRNFVPDSILEFPVPSGELDFATYGEYFVIRERDFLKDYFTAALPNTQRGVEVLMPLEGTGSVTYMPHSFVVDEAGNPPGATASIGVTGISSVLRADPAGTPENVRVENIDEVFLTASSVSINDFRSAYALQVWLERNEIAGSRYTESIQAHFDVKPQDSRLQRPEYCGGGRINVKISEVVSTAYSQNQDDDTIAQGNLAGHGVTYGTANGFSYFATEHGFMYSILSIMPKPSYQNGLPRMFRRKTFLDYPWPTFAKLGEQPVWKWELFFDPAMMVEAEDGSYPIWGYQSRYAEWKQRQSTNCGDFRDNLLFWTLTNEITSEPTLGTAFLSAASTDDGRIFAVDTGQNYWMYIHNSFTVKRALPYFATPSLAN